MLRRIVLGSGALLFGIFFALIFLELTLRLLPVCSGEVAADPDRDWPAHHLIPNRAYTFSAGWDLENVRRGRINNMGYVAPVDYLAGTAGIVVVGDSFVESMMNSYRETLQGALPNYLNKPALVMNFGMSGATLPHDLGVAELVGSRFTPRWAIVVVTSGNFVGGFKASPGYYHWVLGSNSGVELTPETMKGPALKFFRGLLLTRYVRTNLGADLGRLFHDRSRAASEPCVPTELSAGDKQLIAYFAYELPTRFNLPASHVVIVFDADRDAIYRGEPERSWSRCAGRDEQARRLLTRVAAERGINVIEMDPIFRAYFASTGNYLDYSPIDKHWNGASHILAAREVAKIINASVNAGP
jgi:hypothetical protein